MQIFIIWMILVSLLVTLAPFARSEGVKLVDEVKKAETQSTGPETTSNVVGNTIRDGISEMVQQAAIENPITTVKKTAEEAARSVGKSLGQYIRGQYLHIKNEDLLQRFDNGLFQNLSGLQLSPEERRRIVLKIEDAYIQDAESGSFELDQQNFRDLNKVVKKEYAEIELARTRNGNVPTYDYKGYLKTLWTMQDGVLNGPAVTYYRNGEIKFIDLYEGGRKISRKKYDAEGQLMFEQNYDYEKKVVSPTETVTVQKTVTVEPDKAANPAPVKSEPVQASQAPTTPAPAQGSFSVPFKELLRSNPPADDSQ